MSTATDVRVEAASAVARRWEAMGVPFLVVHGLEGYPAGIGRDLDMIMDQERAGPALAEAARVLRGLGWEHLACPPDLWGRRLVAVRSARPPFDYLEFHTMIGVSWTLLTFADHREPPDRLVGPFPVASWAGFAKALLVPLLAGARNKVTPRALGRLGELDQELIARRSGELLGSVGEELAEAVRAGDPDRVLRLAPRVRRAALAAAARRPVRALGRVPGFLGTRLRRLASTTGLRVELTGPPESGLEDLAEAVARHLGHVFLPIVVGPETGWSARVRDQYSVLARQGLVLSTRTEARLTHLQLTAALPSGDEISDDQPLPVDEATAPRVAGWIVTTWCESLACPDRPGPAGGEL